MARRSKAQWRELIADQQSSGLSAVAYCTEHGSNPKYFSARKSKLRSSASNFVRVTPSPHHILSPNAQHSKVLTKQPRIRVIDIELGGALDVRALSLMLDQVLS
ncbi:MAG: hypothetical protein ACI89S_002100 [Gammaproteobacteria bacterium]|jgi:hypothetical protein